MLIRRVPKNRPIEVFWITKFVFTLFELNRGSLCSFSYDAHVKKILQMNKWSVNRDLIALSRAPQLVLFFYNLHNYDESVQIVPKIIVVMCFIHNFSLHCPTQVVKQWLR